MKRRWLGALLVLGLLVSLAGCAKQTTESTWQRATQSKQLVIGLDDSFVPMGFRQKNGELAGFDIDLAKAMLKTMGMTPNFQTIEWSMKETELRNQTIDLIWNGYTKTKAREKTVAFSPAYLDNRQVLVTKKAADINSFKQMTGKTLGVQTGSSGAAALDERPKALKRYIAHGTPVLYDTFNEAFIDLAAGRIQGILMDEVYARYYIAHQADPGAFNVTTGPLEEEQFAIGMRKGDKQLMTHLKEALAKVKADGTYAKLMQKWFDTSQN